MKLNSLLLPITLLFLSSCSSYVPYAISSVDFPLRPPKSVEVFYPGELLPYKEYVEVGSLTIAEGLSRDKMMYVNRLRNLAQESGIDALINVRRVRHENRFADESGTVLDISHSYNATGIKYLRNVDYLDEYVREESFYSWDSSEKNKALSGIIERTPSGRTLNSRFMDNDAQSIYSLYVQEYRDFHLLEEKINWSYKLDASSKVLFAKRYCRSNGWKIKTCKYRYKDGRVNKIIIDFHDKDADTIIHLSYDDAGRISERKLHLTHNRTVKEKYSYDAFNRLIRKNYEIGSNIVGFSQKYVSEYEYYQKEDIHDFIE